MIPFPTVREIMRIEVKLIPGKFGRGGVWDVLGGMVGGRRRWVLRMGL